MIVKYGTFEYALADRYRFEEELGRGAMGIVYRAKDLRLGRPVAIKMLHPALTNELGVARFQSEIRIAASLHHPNIIAVHESGEIDGRLFYVMDYLGGETLRARLQREKQLSVEDALSIVESIADALQYAHDHGVVHRDVKPENILLAEGRACVMDFGLARALDAVDAERLTASGLAVGTPHYLSPEQASAEKEVGPKADQYALACVLYEMLVGEPPFTGPTASAIAMRHISEAPPAMRTRRKTTSVSVEAAVMKAMEKVPADRFSNVRGFVAALTTDTPDLLARGSPIAAPSQFMNVRKTLSLSLLAFGVLIGAIVLARPSWLADKIDDVWRLIRGTAVDTSRYAIFPIVTNGSVQVDPGIDQRFRDALTRWRGLTAASASELSAAVVGQGSSDVKGVGSRLAARSVQAGRYVKLELFPANEGVRLRAELFDAVGRSAPRGTSVFLPAGTAARDSALSHLVYRLLFDDDEASSNEDAASGTSNRAALGAYIRGRAAARIWNLPGADSAFAEAVRHDETFSQGWLGLAQVRAWARDSIPELSDLASKALANPGRLSPTDRDKATALKQFATGDYHAACLKYESLVRSDSMDFGTWFGLGECNRLDPAVISSRSSPSGKAFRGSFYRASIAFERGFDLLPSVASCCRGRSYAVRRRPLLTKYSSIRYGRGLAPDSNSYSAYPELVGDTVGFVPYPASTMGSRPVPARHAAAVEKQREQLFAITAKRVAQSPESPDAMEDLANAMEMQLDRAAADTMRRALSFASDPSQRIRLAVGETWMRLKLAIPDDERGLRVARRLADSLLEHSPVGSAEDAKLLASLAALLGNSNKSAQLSERGATLSVSRLSVPSGVLGSSQRFLAFAAIGGPIDSLQGAEERLLTAIANAVSLEQQPIVRDMLLGRAASLAYPVYHGRGFAQLDSSFGSLVRGEIAHARGDKVGVRRSLTDATQRRSNLRPADLTLDAVYPEAWLYAAVGDSASALAVLGRVLDALAATPAIIFFDVANAGSLSQAMLLRAHLAAEDRDRSGVRKWARALMAITDSSTSLGRTRYQAAQALSR